MKRTRRIISCIILSFIIQFVVFLYLDKVILKESDKFTIQNVEIPAASIDTDVEIPEEGRNIKISYSGRYITYFIDDKLMLVNTKTSEVRNILEDTEILDIKWVPKNNTIFIVEKKDGKVNVKTYNANNGVEQDVCELCNYKNNIKIESFISISAEYVSVSSQGRTTIYRISIDKDVKKLDKTLKSLKSGDVFWNKDVFIYQNSEDKRIYRYTNGSSKKMNIKNSSGMNILKTAGNDVYLGEGSDDNIFRIIYGEDTTDTSKWKSETLEKSVSAKDIFINENNEIFINDSSEGIIKNITTGEKLNYEGKLIEINDRLVFSLCDGKVCLKSIKDFK